MCQPVLLGTFSSAPVHIAVDANYLYGPESGGIIERCSTNGCPGGPGFLIANQRPTMLAVVATGAGVFWASQDASKSAIVSGCMPADCSGGVIDYQSYPSSSPFTGMTADSTNVYWALDPGGGNDTIQSCPVAGCLGGMSKTFDGNDAPAYLAAGAGRVFWSEGGGFVVESCIASGCGGLPNQLVNFHDDVTLINADSKYVYFLDSTALSEYACPVTGCPANGAVKLSGGGQVLGLAAGDGTNAYWANVTSGVTSIQSCPGSGCGGTPTTVVSGVTVDPFEVAVDAKSIYWVNGTNIYKVAK
jgi:hypothetical protein